eukprot:7802695-Pyramimonas_sp.AAC.1
MFICCGSGVIWCVCSPAIGQRCAWPGLPAHSPPCRRLLRNPVCYAPRVPCHLPATPRRECISGKDM